MTYTITPRPAHRDVLLQSEGRPTLLVCVRSEPLDMGALEAEARRIAALLDGRAEAVIAAARDRDGCGEECRAMQPYRGCTCGDEAMRAAIAAYDGTTWRHGCWRSGLTIDVPRGEPCPECGDRGGRA